MDQSDTIGNLAAALVKVQRSLKPIKRNAENPFFKSSYVDLAALSETVLPLLTANGLAVIQGGSGATLETVLVHESGEWVSSSLPLHVGNKPQEMGSAITYARRYALAALVGAVSEGEDDDGNAASHPPARSPAPSPANRPSPASEARPATTPAAPPVASGGSPATLRIKFLDSQQKEGKNGPYTLYSVKFSDDRKASTFSESHGAILKRAKQENLPVEVGFEQKGQYLNIVNVAIPGELPLEEDDDSVPF